MSLLEHCFKALQVLSGTVNAPPETIREAENAITQWATSEPDYAITLAQVLVSDEARSVHGGRECAVLAAVLLRQFVNRYSDQYLALDENKKAMIESNTFAALMSASEERSSTCVEERQSAAALLASIVLTKWSPENVSILTSTLVQITRNSPNNACGVVTFLGATVSALRISGNDDDDETESSLLLLLRVVILVGSIVFSWPIKSPSNTSNNISNSDTTMSSRASLAQLTCQVDMAGVLATLLDCLRPEETILSREPDVMMDRAINQVFDSEKAGSELLRQLYAILQDQSLIECWMAISSVETSGNLPDYVRKMTDGYCRLLYQVARCARFTAVVVGSHQQDLEQATLTLFNRVAQLCESQYTSVLNSVTSNTTKRFPKRIVLYTSNGTVITLPKFAACVVSLFDIVTTQVSSDELSERIKASISDLVTSRICQFAQFPPSFYFVENCCYDLSNESSTSNYTRDSEDASSNEFDPITFLEDEEDSQDFLDLDNPRVVATELIIHLIDRFDCRKQIASVLLNWTAQFDRTVDQATVPPIASEAWQRSISIASARECVLYMLGTMLRSASQEAWMSGDTSGPDSGGSSNGGGDSYSGVILCQVDSDRWQELLNSSLKSPWPLLRARGMWCVSLLLAEQDVGMVGATTVQAVTESALSATDMYLTGNQQTGAIKISGQELVAKVYMLRNFAHIMSRSEDLVEWDGMKNAVSQLAMRIANESCSVALGLSVDTVHFALETLLKVLRACSVSVASQLQSKVVQLCATLWPLVYHDWFVRELLGDLIDALVLSLGSQGTEGEPPRWPQTLAVHVQHTIMSTAASQDMLALGHCLSFYLECLQRCSNRPPPLTPIEEDLAQVLPLIIAVAESARATIRQGLSREDGTRVVRISCQIVTLLVRNTPPHVMQLQLPVNSPWANVLPGVLKGGVTLGQAIQSVLSDWVIGTLAASLRLGDGELVETLENGTIGGSSNLGQFDIDEDVASSNPDIIGDPDGLVSDLTEVVWALAQELFAKCISVAESSVQFVVIRRLREALDTTSDVRVATSVLGMVGMFIVSSEPTHRNASLTQFWVSPGSRSPTGMARSDGNMELAIEPWVKWLPQMNRIAYRNVAAVALVHLLCSCLVSVHENHGGEYSKALTQHLIQLCSAALTVVCQSLALISNREEVAEAKREQRAQAAASVVAAYSGMEQDEGGGILLSDMLDLNNVAENDDDNIWENSDNNEPVKLFVASELFSLEPKRSLSALFSLLGSELGAQVLGGLAADLRSVVENALR